MTTATTQPRWSPTRTADGARSAAPTRWPRPFSSGGSSDESPSAAGASQRQSGDHFRSPMECRSAAAGAGRAAGRPVDFPRPPLHGRRPRRRANAARGRGPAMSAEQIRRLNDAFRTSMSGGKVLMTAGVDALPSDVKTMVIRRVATFSEFTGDNDPHGERDFGSFEIAGQKFFWK